VDDEKDTEESCVKFVKDLKWATRKHYSSKEKIRIVLDGLRGEDSIAELYRREGIAQGIYYKWCKHCPAVHIYMHERGLHGGSVNRRVKKGPDCGVKRVHFN
jgi:hypothetical protein